MSADPEIRSPGSGELAVVASLIAGFRDHLGARRPSDAALERVLPGALRDPGVAFRCAWLDGVPVGYSQTLFFASVWSGGLEAHLEDLFVIEAARGRAVGRALFRDAVARARERGAGRLRLTTNEGNTTAQALYRSEGLAPEAHARYPGRREVLWSRPLESEK